MKHAQITGIIEFPAFTGTRVQMMPFIQGNSESLPENLKHYADIIDQHYLEKGEVGYLTIDESMVEKDKSQRGFNALGLKRNVHIEVGILEGRNRWGGGWRGRDKVLLEDTTRALIANSIDDTCRFWENEERSYTKDGDLSEYIERYPEETGVLMKAGELANISIFTPHECINQKFASQRQFFRIIGAGVHGREDYFTINPLMS